MTKETASDSSSGLDSNKLSSESFIHKAATYLTTLILSLPALLFMSVFNRTRIINKKNLTTKNPPFLFVSNHVTMLDDLFLGPILFLPRGLFDYKFIPYHTPEQKNFYVNPVVSWVLDHVKCLPLTRGKGFFQPGMQKVIGKVIQGGVVHIYPEGTRTRTGELGKGKAGVGRIIYESRCSAVPCYHQGLNKILPIGTKIPRIGKNITVIVGDQLHFDKYFEMENNVNTWQMIVDDIINALAKLKDEIEKDSAET